MDHGITSVGAYAPRLRIARSTIAAAHRWMAPSLAAAARGERAFCSWDEDAITMAVEAGRACIDPAGRDAIEHLVFASATAPYADMSNAAVVAGALDLSDGARTSEQSGCQRIGVGALIEALERGSRETLVVASERPLARPASVQELQYGAGAAAFRVGSGAPLARYLGAASVTAPFADHVRTSGREIAYFWEERWVRDEGLGKIVPKAVSSALDKAGLSAGDLDHFILASPIRGATGGVARAIGFAGTVADGLEAELGFCGAAQPLLMLAKVLETAEPGARILVVGFGQGAEALVLEVTGVRSSGRSVSEVLADKIVTEDYLRLLSFSGLIELDWSMRAEVPDKAAFTAAWRADAQLSAFKAGRCARCGAVQFPQLAYCVSPGCGAPSGDFAQVSLADAPARLLTVTADWLSYHPAPPLHVGFVQFENGARLMMEVVDAPTEAVEVGIALRMVYRLKKEDLRSGYRRYFWKATPTTL